MALLRVRYQTHEFGDLDIHVRTLRDTEFLLAPFDGQILSYCRTNS